MKMLNGGSTEMEIHLEGFRPVFEEKDAMSDAEERVEQPEYLETYLDDRAPALDVRALYDQLTEKEE